jgi:hypothetical protein
MDDARAAMAWAADPEWFRYLPHDPVSTLGEEQVFLQGVVDQALAVPRRPCSLGIIGLGTSELVRDVDHADPARSSRWHTPIT